MNAKQQSAYTDAGLPEFDPQARAAFIAGWRAACKHLRYGLRPFPKTSQLLDTIRALPAYDNEEIPQ